MEKSTPYKRPKAKRVNVLIVESNPDQWLIIRSVLAQCIPEVEPIWIDTPVQALAYLDNCLWEKTSYPQLILSELCLPQRIDGLALLTALKDHPIHRQVPIAILSDFRDYADIVNIYNYGIDSYMVKPDTYHQWLVGFQAFRDYWWDWASSTFRVPAGRA